MIPANGRKLGKKTSPIINKKIERFTRPDPVIAEARIQRRLTSLALSH